MKHIIAIVAITICVHLSKACPKEGCFKTIGNHEYFINPDYKYNFFQSESECTRKNMTLVTLDSAEKVGEINALLGSTFEGKPMPYLFIGGFTWKDYNFVWISTGKPFAFTNWHSGEPNYENHNCVHLGRFEDGSWNNVPCAARFGYICEML